VTEDFTLKAYRSKTETLNAARLDSIIVIVLCMYINYNSETFRSAPPLIGTLREHVKRRGIISGHLWGRADESRRDLLPFVDWGWSVHEGTITPVWSEDIVLSYSIGQILMQG